MYQSISTQILQAWQSSRVFKIGILAITLLSVLYLLQYTQEMIDSIDEQLQEQQTTLIRLKNIASESRWQERAEQARSQKIQQQEKLRIAQSKSLSHASIQSVINKKLKYHSIENVNIKINTSLVTQIHTNKIWQVNVRLNGQLNTDKILKLLKMLENDGKYLYIERLSIKKQRFDLQFFTYVIKPKSVKSEY